jgi:N-acetylmuramoyl-L-alanine amidase
VDHDPAAKWIRGRAPLKPAPGGGFRRVPTASLASLIRDWLHSSRARDALLELLAERLHPVLIPPRECLWFRDDVRSALEHAFSAGELVAYEAHRGAGAASGGGGGGARPASAAREPPPPPAPPAPPRRARTFVAIRLLREGGEPVPHHRFRLELPDGGLRHGALDCAGFARIDGIESGRCGVTFPELDRGDWRAERGRFAEFWSSGAGSPKQHVVKQGEHLTRIALRHGFHRTPAIWHHPDNTALSRQRKTPNVLAPGDRLVIPPKEEGIVWVPDSQEHRFLVLETPLALRFALLDHDFAPVPAADAHVDVEESPATLTTDRAGRVERAIPPTAERGRLVAPGRDLRLLVGHLDPVDTPSGLRARLNHLDYDAGPIDAGADEELRSALEELQCDFGLTVDGLSGPEAQAKRVQVHGC